MEKSSMNPWMVSTLVLAGLIAGFAIAQIPALQIGGQSAPAAVVAQPTQPQQPPEKILTAEQISALPDDDFAQGDADAAITMVEFSDYQCPYCQKFVKTILPSIVDEYVKTGKVK